jgi:hypothetical protein
MTTTLYATFDGEVLRPDHPVALPPNPRVRITVETEPGDEPRAGSFLRTAQGLDLDGPTDWSARLDDYLYGEEPERGA